MLFAIYNTKVDSRERVENPVLAVFGQKHIPALVAAD
jgi:hypothetical protein